MAEAYMTQKQIKAVKSKATRLCSEESVGWQIPVMKMGAMSRVAQEAILGDLEENSIREVLREWLQQNAVRAS